LGTGLLGRAIAERLQSVGHIVTVYNRTATKTLPLQACVITVVTRPEQAMAQADCVVLMLADAAAIRAVLLTLALLQSSATKTVIQMEPSLRKRAWPCRPRSNESVHRSEAPVLGNLAEAQVGTVFVMVRRYRRTVCPVGPLFGSLSREPCLAGAGADHCAGTWRFDYSAIFEVVNPIP